MDSVSSSVYEINNHTPLDRSSSCGSTDHRPSIIESCNGHTVANVEHTSEIRNSISNLSTSVNSTPLTTARQRELSIQSNLMKLNNVLTDDCVMNRKASIDLKPNVVEHTSEIRNSISNLSTSVNSTPLTTARHRELSIQSNLMKLNNVLIVDDSVINRKMMSRWISKNTIVVDEAENGKMAVDLVKLSFEKNTPYHLILMDYSMPIMDGPTATKLIRDMKFNGLILGVTGNALPCDIQNFIAKGANHVLTKPVDMLLFDQYLTGKNTHIVICYQFYFLLFLFHQSGSLATKFPMKFNFMHVFSISCN